MLFIFVIASFTRHYRNNFVIVDALTPQGSPFSVFLYDSVYLWAKTVDGVIRMNKNPRDGSLVLAMAKTHVFQGTVSSVA